MRKGIEVASSGILWRRKDPIKTSCCGTERGRYGTTKSRHAHFLVQVSSPLLTSPERWNQPNEFLTGNGGKLYLKFVFSSDLFLLKIGATVP